MQSDTSGSSGPQAPSAPSAPVAPGSTPSATKPNIVAKPPAKPISKDQIDKAQRLAASIGSQPGVTDPKSLGTKVKQQIGSVGGTSSDVGLMTGLVQAELANQGMDIHEDFASTADYFDVLDRPEIEGAFSTMLDACGFHESAANTVFRALARTGVYERPLDNRSTRWTPEKWRQVHQQCLPHFDVRPGNGGQTIVINLIP